MKRRNRLGCYELQGYALIALANAGGRQMPYREFGFCVHRLTYNVKPIRKLESDIVDWAIDQLLDREEIVQTGAGDSVTISLTDTGYKSAVRWSQYFADRPGKTA